MQVRARLSADRGHFGLQTIRNRRSEHEQMSDSSPDPPRERERAFSVRAGYARRRRAGKPVLPHPLSAREQLTSPTSRLLIMLAAGAILALTPGCGVTYTD